jgi:hypothetical protein
LFDIRYSSFHLTDKPGNNVLELLYYSIIESPDLTFVSSLCAFLPWWFKTSCSKPGFESQGGCWLLDAGTFFLFIVQALGASRQGWISPFPLIS